MTPWTVARQTPLDSSDKNTGVGSHSFLQGSSQPRDQTWVPSIVGRLFTSEPPGKPKNTGVGSLSLLQQIFLTQESNRGLLHCRWIPYQLSYQGLIHSLQLNTQHLPGHPNEVSIINTWPLNIILKKSTHTADRKIPLTSSHALYESLTFIRPSNSSYDTRKTTL